MEQFLFRPEPIVWVQNFFGPGHAGWFRAISELGSTWGVLLVVGGAFWLWGRRDAYALIGIVVVEVALSLVLNQFIHVQRPDASAIIEYERVAVGSFPSGHVFLTTVLWGLLYARRRIPGWGLGLVLAAIGIARMYLGVHYAADIFGGMILGLAVVALYRRSWNAIEYRLTSVAPPIYLVVGLLGIGCSVAGIFLGFYGSSPYRWHAAGLVFGGIAALMLEYRFVRYVPELRDTRRVILQLAIGVVPLAPVIWYDRATGEDDLQLAALLVALAAVWAFLTVPAIFVGLDLSRERLSGRRERAWRKMRAILLTAAGILLLAGIYGALVEPRMILDIENESASIPGLPEEWVGQRVAVMGDLQVGMWGANTGMMRQAVEKILKEEPAAVLIPGDFIYHAGDDPAELVSEVADILRPLARSGIPVFGVFGNHDWGISTKRDSTRNLRGLQILAATLDTLGIEVLRNEAAEILPPGGGAPFYVVGIGARWAGQDDPSAALDAVPPGAPRIVFMHHPDSFPEIPAGAAPLAVAGHTHGGQVSIPFTPDWTWLTFTTDDEVHAAGWIDGFGEPGNRLYINRGIGMSLLPIRINAAPELTLFTLAQ